MPDTIPNDTKLQDDLKISIAALKTLVDPGPQGALSTLGASWRYLQIYSTWGLRLPKDRSSLLVNLQITDSTPYPFFDEMYESYDLIFLACELFQVKIFPQVVSVGSSILSYAKDAAKSDGAVFDLLKEMVTTSIDREGALELIGDLQGTVTKNVSKSAKVTEDLNLFKAKLIEAQSRLDAVGKTIQSNKDTSEEFINTANGGADVIGSLAQLEAMKTQMKDDYDHYVVVAATTVTYAWVPIFGIIAAGAVAGVYGDKAVKELQKYNDKMAEITAKTNLLNIAIRTNGIQKLAKTGVDEAITNTDQAIVCSTTIQNAWSQIGSQLTEVSRYLEKMIKDDGSLKNTRVVAIWADCAGKEWGLLIPPLKELTKNPYITVESKNTSLVELVSSETKNFKVKAG